MKNKITAAALGATAALALALAPLAPASAAGSAWGVWTETLVNVPSSNTLTFSGAGMINATWSVYDAPSYEVLTTEDEDEYFTASTPIGAVFGANGPSQSTNFLKVTSENDTSSTYTTEVIFDSVVPAGQLGFAASDIDYDSVTITAEDAEGNLLTGAQIIGTASPDAFNFCNQTGGPACTDTEVPTVVVNANDVTVNGVASSLAGSDGATFWAHPSAAVKTVYFTYVNNDPTSPSTSRYWFAQTIPSLPDTGMSASLSLTLTGIGAALLAAGGLMVARRRKA